MRLYLASTSPARLATLRAVGVEPVLLSSGVDEEAAVASSDPMSADEMVLFLARLKAEAVVAPEIDGFILGGDSAFELDGITYGKPHLPSVARERWLLQRGREGHLHSGHWLIDHRGGVPGRGIGAVSTAAVTFADDITDAEIDAYIETGEPLHVAGAFTIDGFGGAFVSGIEGDHHNVVGVSLPLLRELVLELGHAWPDLWT